MSNLNWDVPQELVPLPSNGIIYSPDSVLYNKQTLQIKAMTANEEDILTSNAYLKEGSVITNLIKSCLIDKDVDVDDLLSGDKNALMVSIRITGYGKDYAVKHECDKCAKLNSVNVDLTSLEIKRFGIKPIEEGKNEFSFDLPVSKKRVVFKYLTGHDEKENRLRDQRLEAIGISANNSVTQQLKDVIISIDGITNKLEIEKFVKNMPALDSRKLRLFIKGNEPGIDMKYKYSCSNCGNANEFMLPITSEFFWPST